MKGFTAFMKKELLEAVRSYKLVILLIVFAALGFMNPVSARYLPELVAGFLPEGMHMEIPQPVVQMCIRDRSIHRQSDMNRISISHPLVTVQGNWRSCEG